MNFVLKWPGEGICDRMVIDVHPRASFLTTAVYSGAFHRIGKYNTGLLLGWRAYKHAMHQEIRYGMEQLCIR